LKNFKSCFVLKLHENVIYRANIFLNLCFGIIPLIVNIFLWSAIYGTTQGPIGGFTFNQMITYFILVFFCFNVTNAREVAVKIAEEIRDGTIHNFMIKPVNYLLLNFKFYICEKLIYIITIFVPFILFLFAIRNYIYLKIENLLLFLISLFLAICINYIIFAILGLLTTWFEEISALLDLWVNITEFLSGGLFPLSLLPIKIQTIFSFLPFGYIISLPINIYMMKELTSEIIINILVQVIWIMILIIILVILWKKVTNKYSGYGA